MVFNYILLSLFISIKLVLNNKFAEQIPIEQKNGLQYVKISLGQPPQNFNVVINTLESMTWVPSVDCTTCSKSNFDKNNSTNYNNLNTKDNANLRSLQSSTTSVSSVSSNTNDESLPKEVIEAKLANDANAEKGRYSSIISSTSLDKNSTFTIESKEGIIKGIEVGEVISLGTSLKGINFSFIEALQINRWTSSFGEEGVLGLSYININGESLGLINNLKNSGSIEKKVFSISKNELYVGNYPNEVRQFPNKYSTCNVTLSEGLAQEYRDAWVCDVSHLSFSNSYNFSESIEIQGRAVFNSALNPIIAPYEYASTFKDEYFSKYFIGKICNQVERDDYIYFTCELDDSYLFNSNKNIEDVSLLIGGYGLVVPGYKLFSRSSDLFDINTSSSNNKNLAYFNIVFKKVNHNLWEVGRILLDEYVVVYDSEKDQVGFFGENKKNFYNEWLAWWNLQFNSYTSQEHYRLLIIIGVALGGALVLLTLCLVIQAFRDKDDQQTAPLSEEEMHNRDNSS